MERSIWGFIIALIVLLVGAWYLVEHRHETATAVIPATSSGTDGDAVMRVVLDFGTKLKDVSLTADKDQAAAAIAVNYSGDISPDLLASWEADPSQAVGRLTSSPWPDRIAPSDITENTDGSYTVTGNVLEKTSVEEANGGTSDTYPITLVVKNIDGRWLISDVRAGLAVQSSPAASTTP